MKAAQISKFLQGAYFRENSGAKGAVSAERLSKKEALGCLHGAMWGALFSAGTRVTQLAVRWELQSEDDKMNSKLNFDRKARRL